MKKNKKNKVYKFIFMVFFLSFLVIYFSELTGYYEYQNHKKTTLTEEQIKKFETDVANGKEVDINEYLVVDTTSYNNNLSKLASKLSDGISNLVQSGVESTFKFLSNIVDE
ncbi:MAG: hypothetical protein E7174_01750 [Firmicutes bacterium]|nr:hypothetical protein [Bacillota bacterium]